MCQVRRGVCRVRTEEKRRGRRKRSKDKKQSRQEEESSRSDEKVGKSTNWSANYKEAKEIKLKS
jgi:hypothetical protein